MAGVTKIYKKKNHVTIFFKNETVGEKEMKTGKLLEELIDIVQTPKTDFAISMNMTPSGLSKILKGGRLPNSAGRQLLILQIPCMAIAVI